MSPPVMCEFVAFRKARGSKKPPRSAGGQEMVGEDTGLEIEMERVVREATFLVKIKTPNFYSSLSYSSFFPIDTSKKEREGGRPSHCTSRNPAFLFHLFNPNAMTDVRLRLGRRRES